MDPSFIPGCYFFSLLHFACPGQATQVQPLWQVFPYPRRSKGPCIHSQWTLAIQMFHLQPRFLQANKSQKPPLLAYRYVHHVNAVVSLVVMNVKIQRFLYMGCCGDASSLSLSLSLIFFVTVFLFFAPFLSWACVIISVMQCVFSVSSFFLLTWLKSSSSLSLSLSLSSCSCSVVDVVVI